MSLARARGAQRLLRRPATRKYSSETPPHGSESHGHDAAPTTESFGRGFYITIAAVPLSILAYQLTSGEDSAFSNLLRRYADYRQTWEERNTLHTKMIEQAAFDRNLFQSGKANPHVPLRFQEIFNTGSPWNVPAGHGAANLDKLVAHYEKENREAEERQLKRAAANTQASRRNS
ncbi:MAG: hypothetical protein M1824_004864 [Vezdaea acicularis]|nr:MAG: hypothetical protein M1824_004864 [Vezdaea acicularis]